MSAPDDGLPSVEDCRKIIDATSCAPSWLDGAGEAKSLELDDDREISAIGTCVDALRGLDSRACERVLIYLRDRFVRAHDKRPRPELREP